MRSQLNRSPLQRLLSDGRGVAEANAGGPDLAQRWGAWLSVADAITLRTGLQTASVAKCHAAPAPPVALEEELARVRATLTQAITAQGGVPSPKERHAAARRRSSPVPTVAPVVLDLTTEFTLLHQRHHDDQRRMALSVGSLRAHVRQVLTSTSPELAKLAALDNTMEQLLGVREQNLLATIPALLKRRFDQRRSDASASATPMSEPTTVGAPDTTDAAASNALAQLKTEFQQALLAELDLRLQPVVGMVQAHRQAHHSQP